MSNIYAMKSFRILLRTIQFSDCGVVLEIGSTNLSENLCSKLAV